MKRTILMLGVLASFIPGVLALAKDSDDHLWKVAVHTGISPFVFYNEERQITGADIDLVQILAEEEEIDVEFIDVPFEDLLTMVEKREADLAISAITVTEERQEQVNFTGDYLTTCARILVLDDRKIATFDELAGKKVGVLEGSDDEVMVREIPNVEVLCFTKESNIYQLLSEQEVDAVLIDEEIAKHVNAEHEDTILLEEKIQEEKYAIAVHKDAEELLNILNLGISTLKDTGELDKIFEKYIVIEETEAVDSEEE